MKKLILILILIISANSVFAQDSKYAVVKVVTSTYAMGIIKTRIIITKGKGASTVVDLKGTENKNEDVIDGNEQLLGVFNELDAAGYKLIVNNGLMLPAAMGSTSSITYIFKKD